LAVDNGSIQALRQLYMRRCTESIWLITFCNHSVNVQVLSSCLSIRAEMIVVRSAWGLKIAGRILMAGHLGLELPKSMKFAYCVVVIFY